ncbi:MAG: hypothetical protein QM808_09995 [Steroidobacteraceae bacterium]
MIEQLTGRLACSLMLLALTPLAQAQNAVSNLEQSYRFLVNDRSSGGVLYTASANKLRGANLPLSFYDSADYWGLSVCAGANTPCAVTDIYRSTDSTLTPQAGAAGDLQTERVNVHNGANIYDAATWQIAVMLGQVVNKFTLPAKQDAFALINNQNRLLDGEANRAPTRGQVFRYNGQAVSSSKQAYAFRMLPRSWLSSDPLMGTRYDAWITAQNLPINPDYQRGKVTWSDWKPITGENAWAFLLGPLHAAYIYHVMGEQRAYVPFHDEAVQRALTMLPTFVAMQSAIGGVYYAPSGTAGNEKGTTASPYQLSVENNLSLYAGLQVLTDTLRNELKHESGLSSGDRNNINAALKTIDMMINGGRTANKSTEGLLAFFKTHAWRSYEFIQGGSANDPQQKSAWVPALEPKAVDTNTWGIAALGAAQIDQWFGFGAAYKNWQQLKTWGGYGANKQLQGVGYSNWDGNGTNADGTYKQGILSAEWTAGAINMVRSMQRYYRNIAATSNNYAEAQTYLATLQQDETSMLAGLQTLRFDGYLNSSFPGKPDNYAKLLEQVSGQRTQPYLYASRRYYIPFGWYANPLPSTCATAWAIMLADGYDPFVYGGGMR